MHGRIAMNSLIIPIKPMGKPRMTQRDRWAKRDCVLRYHAFRDEMRLRVGNKIPSDIVRLSWIAYLPIPKSWSKKKKAEMAGQYHRQKPDRDNIDKAILDSLFSEDCMIAAGQITKRWDDGDGPRIELFWGS